MGVCVSVCVCATCVACRVSVCVCATCVARGERTGLGSSGRAVNRDKHDTHMLALPGAGIGKADVPTIRHFERRSTILNHDHAPNAYGCPMAARWRDSRWRGRCSRG